MEDTVHDAIEGMQEELQAFRVAVTEEDRFEKLDEAEHKRIKRENALLKEDKLRLERENALLKEQDEKLAKVRAKLGELQDEEERLQDSLRQSRKWYSNLLE